MMQEVRVAPVNRRSLLASVAALGGSLALGFKIPFGSPAAHAARAGAEITAWIVIKPDDSIIIRVAKSEMGQGVLTALPMLVAEELECDWSKVRAEYAAPQENLRRRRAWGDMSTGGSRSVRSSQLTLRRAGATAREMLIGAAAAQWVVPASECRAHNSIITHVPSGRTLSFGQVAGAAAQIAAPTHIKLKNPSDWRLIGTPQRRLDAIGKVRGEPIYGIDVRLPDMLYAALIACPVFGGKFRSVGDLQTSPACKACASLCSPDGRRGDHCRRLVAAKKPLRLSTSPGTRERTGRSRGDHQTIFAYRPRRRGGYRTQGWRRAAALAQVDKRRSRIRSSVPCSRHHGAAERDGSRSRRSNRGLGADAEWRSGALVAAARRRVCRQATSSFTRQCSAAASAGAA
jgi:hypothetical protein